MTRNDVSARIRAQPRVAIAFSGPKLKAIKGISCLHSTILRLTIIAEDQSQFEQEVTLIIEWYNEHRPHNTLAGKTPNEVYLSRPAASEQPRHEPRKRWPRGSPCAKPQVDIDGEAGHGEGRSYLRQFLWL